jgi:nitroreductase
VSKLADTVVQIDALIARRWSGRAFDRDRPLAREQLLALLEAARWAPSCYGEQPWRYLVWDRFVDAQRWQSAFECLSEGNRTWAVHAPVLLLAAADRVRARDGQTNRWAQYDCGAASENLCLQAISAGLVVHQMGGFDVQRLRTVFEIPERYDCMAMIAVGHPGDPALLPEPYHSRELGTRARRPLRNTVFEGGWERSLGGLESES